MHFSTVLSKMSSTRRKNKSVFQEMKVCGNSCGPETSSRKVPENSFGSIFKEVPEEKFLSLLSNKDSVFIELDDDARYFLFGTNR
jgi:hypothetical protein